MIFSTIRGRTAPSFGGPSKNKGQAIGEEKTKNL